MKSTAWYQNNRFMKVGPLGGWIGRIRWFNVSISEARPKPNPFRQLSDSADPLRQKYHGKTALSFTLEWLQNEKALIVRLTAKDGAILGRKVAASRWSSCPFSEDQVRQIKAIMTSNLDMWVCFQKACLFIVWFARRGRDKTANLNIVRGEWPFSYEEYDYFAELRLRDWDLTQV